MFASTFLATDILCEKYSAKDSRIAIILGVVSQLIFVSTTQLALAYIPSTEDLGHKAMMELFSINLRVSLASVTMFFASNMLDIYLFERLKKKYPNKLWLRNNVATIISNCLENYIFSLLACLGLFEIQTIIEIATVASVIEMSIALLDTPFLYLAKSKIGDNISLHIKS